jgi:hypothetical protein
MEQTVKNERAFVELTPIIDTLRMWSKLPKMEKETVIIPDGCEKYGFAEGEHDLGTLLHFLADMLE